MKLSRQCHPASSVPDIATIMNTELLTKSSRVHANLEETICSRELK